jgi:hypothetical protein
MAGTLHGTYLPKAKLLTSRCTARACTLPPLAGVSLEYDPAGNQVACK